MTLPMGDMMGPQGMGPMTGQGEGLGAGKMPPLRNEAQEQKIDLMPADSVDGIRPITAPETYNDIEIPQGVVLYVGTVKDTGEEAVQSVGYDSAVINEEELNNFIQSVLPVLNEAKERTQKTPIIGGDNMLPEGTEDQGL